MLCIKYGFLYVYVFIYSFTKREGVIIVTSP